MIVQNLGCGKSLFSGSGNGSSAADSKDSGGSDSSDSNDSEDEDSNETKDSKKTKKTDKFVNSNLNSVECVLTGLNEKIALTSVLEVGSNASSTRVCMSSQACLRLINDYAATHNCRLTLGKSTSSNNNNLKCTGISPASKVTCNNARTLSDTELINILASMATNN